MNETNDCVILKKRTVYVYAIMIFAIALVPIVSSIVSDTLYFIVSLWVLFGIIILVSGSGMIVSVILKFSPKAASAFFLLLAISSSGLFGAHIYGNRSVSEEYYAKLNAIVRADITPPHVKRFIYDIAQDGTITYNEWIRYAIVCDFDIEYFSFKEHDKLMSWRDKQVL